MEQFQSDRNVKNHVRRYAHLEYSNGFLVFDRTGNSKEVWCLASIFTENHPSLVKSLPDQAQEDASTEAENVYPLDTSRRGHFVPWALIQNPGEDSGAAFRFVWPTLLVVSESHGRTWDIRTGEQTLHIKEDRNTEDLYVNYVDISEQHIFIAGSSISIYCQQSGHLLLVVDCISTLKHTAVLTNRYWPRTDIMNTNTLLPHALELVTPDCITAFNRPSDFKAGKITLLFAMLI